MSALTPSSYAPAFGRWTLTRVSLALCAVAGISCICFLPTKYAVAVFALVLTTAFTLRYPVVGLCLLAFSVPWGSAVSPGGLPSFVTPTDVIAAELGAAWIVDAVARRRTPVSDRTLAPYIVLYVVATAVSSTQAQDLAASGREIIKWTEFAVVFFAAAAFLRTRHDLHLLTAALVGGGVSQALLGFEQFVRQAGPAAFGLHRAFFRSYGTFDQPNPYAGYLNMVIPLAIVFTVRARHGWERTLYGCAALAMIAALVASQSRGAILALLAAGTVLALFLVPISRIPIGIAALATVVFACGASFGIFATGPIDRVAGSIGLGGVAFGNVTNANFSAVERAAHWLAGVRMFAGHPFLGVGIGNYAEAYPAVHPRGWYASLEHAHNYFINIAAEAGIFGLTTYTLLAGSALWYSYAITRRARDVTCFGVSLGALGALVATNFHNLFDVLYVHGMATLLGSILALASAGRTIDWALASHSDTGDGA
ncbi:MAG TPA: O-antigen ligase family protein [Chloroflexota bacterium]